MRILLSLMLSILLFLQARLWLSDEGMNEVWRLESQIAERTIENHRLAIRNSALEGEVFNLKEGVEAAEERARTDLGMIAEGETFYMVIRKETQSESLEKQNVNTPFSMPISSVMVE